MKKEMTLEITNRCMNNCIYCSSNSDCHCNEFISLEKIKAIVNDAINLGFNHINISGGEPFLHRDIINIVKFIYKKGLSIDIYTSGIIEVNHHAESITDNMMINISPYIEHMIFNVQTLDADMYKRIVNEEHNLDLLLYSIDKAISYKITTEVNLVPNKLNKAEILPIIIHMTSLGVNKVNILRLVNQGRAREYDIELNDQEIDDIMRKIKLVDSDCYRIRHSFYGCCTEKCTAAKNKIVIKYNGQVLPCEKYKETINNMNIYLVPLKKAYELQLKFYLEGGFHRG